VVLGCLAATVLLVATVDGATVVSDSKAGSTWTGLGNGVPDLSNSDYLDGLTDPFTVGAGSTWLTTHCADMNTVAGRGVLIDGVGSTVNNQTLILGATLTPGAAEYTRLMIDLQAGAGKSVFVEEFNSYGMVTTDSRRNYQKYDLYGSGAATAPPIDGDPIANGWTLIAAVDVEFPLSTHQTSGVHIDDIDQDLRYLLFHAVNSDVHSASWPGNHYVELDVVVPGPPPAPRGVTAGTSSIINDYDYTETWTIGTGASTEARSNYVAQTYPLPAGVVPLEDTRGNPPVNWSTTLGSIATDADNWPTAASPWPGGTAAGTATGMTQSGSQTEMNFTIPYGLRSNFIVQFDSLLATARVNIFVNNIGFVGSAPDVTTITDNVGLAVFFRHDSHTGPNIGVYNGITEIDTGLTTGLDASEEEQWHNFAVQFDLDNGELEFWVNEVHRGRFDYQTAFPALSASNAHIGVGSNGAQNRLWTDNFQVGSPKHPTRGTTFVIR